MTCPGGLTSFTIPQGVTSIARQAFGGCWRLTDIIIPQGVTSLGTGAFQECNGLTSMIIPEGITSIGMSAFRECKRLASITINSATTTIYDSEDTIPATTKIIGYDPSTAKDYAAKYNRTFEAIGNTSPVTVKGTISLPPGVTWPERYHVSFFYRAESMSKTESILCPAGENTVSFEFNLPQIADGYKIKVQSGSNTDLTNTGILREYYLAPNTGAVPNGYAVQWGEAPLFGQSPGVTTVKVFLPQVFCISGKISLPAGVTADIDFYPSVTAVDISTGKTLSMTDGYSHFAAGTQSLNYVLSVPVGSEDCAVVAHMSKYTLIQGVTYTDSYYNPAGSVAQLAAATRLNRMAGDRSNIDITLVPAAGNNATLIINCVAEGAAVFQKTNLTATVTGAELTKVYYYLVDQSEKMFNIGESFNPANNWQVEFDPAKYAKGAYKLAAGGIRKDNGEKVYTNPINININVERPVLSIAGTDPVSGAPNVSVKQEITITFNKTLDKNSIDQGKIIVRNTNPKYSNDSIALNCTADGDKLKITRKPGWGDWTYLASYSVQIKAGAVKDTEGGALGQDYTFSFTIQKAPDTSPPEIIKRNPDSAHSVNVPAGTLFSYTFDEPVQAGSNFEGIQVKITDGQSTRICDNVKKELTGNTLVISRKLGWPLGAELRVSIPKDSVTDQNGNAYAWDAMFSYLIEQPSVDLSISSVTPVQVLEGAPLVERKQTAVRVGISKRGGGAIKNVALTLSGNGQSIDEYYVQFVKDAAYNDYVYSNKQMKVEMQFDAGDQTKYVYFFGDFLAPTAFDTEYSVKVDSKNNIIETDENNNLKTFKLKASLSPKKPVQLRYYRLDLGDYSAFQAACNDANNFIKNVYPVADYYTRADVNDKWDTNGVKPDKNGKKFNEAGLMKWILEREKEAIKSNPNYDCNIVIVPKGWFKNNTYLTSATGVQPGNVFVRNKIVIAEPGDNNIAHELGHYFGLRNGLDVEEYDQKNHYPPNVGFDGMGRYAGNGFWIDKKIAIQARPYLFCFMSAHKEGINYWTDPDCYEKLCQKLCYKTIVALGNKAASQSLAGSALSTQAPNVDKSIIMVAGIAYPNGSVTVDEWVILASGQQSELIPGPYCFEYLDQNGKKLGESSFGIDFEFMGEKLTEAPFVFTIPYLSGTAKMVVKYNGSIVNEKAISVNKPVVKVQSPTAGEQLNGKTVIAWTGSDADGDKLTYSVLFSQDNGSNWSMIADNLTDSSLEWDAGNLPYSTQYRIKVMASDGFNTGEDVSAPFTVLDQVPPSWPAGSQVTASSISFEEITLEWTPASDNTGVVSYTVYCNGQPLPAVESGNFSYHVSGLTPSTAYSFLIEARDAAGNVAAGGPTLTVSTSTPGPDDPPVDSQFTTWAGNTSATPVSADKIWNVKFSRPVEPSTVTSAGIFVCRAGTGEKVPVSLEVASDMDEGTSVVSVIPDQLYDQQGSYVLYITKMAKDNEGNALKQAIRMPFAVK